MSVRACINQQALCPDRVENLSLRTPKAPRKAQFLHKFVVNESTRLRLRGGASRWSAAYTDELRRDHHDFDGYAVGEDRDVRTPSSNYEEHRFSKEGDVATRNGFSQMQGDDMEDASTDGAYYAPVVGHRVLGVVVSGNYAKLEVNIGAAKLGHLRVQDLFSEDWFDIDERKWVLADDDEAAAPPGCGCPRVVYDEEVHNYAAPAPLVVDVGTVLEMEVVGQTMRGNPLLSVRKAAQHLEWNRVMQIKAANEPLQVKIVDFNGAGVITKVEGLRAFLPLGEFIKHPGVAKAGSLEAYVGRTLWVAIAHARESRGNITLSEKDAWIKRNLQLGSLLDGAVTKIFSYGALVQVTDTDICGMIHVSNIAAGRVSAVSDVFEIGEQVKVILVPSPVPDRLSFSTALLETEPGLVLWDKERVFREAEQTATALWNNHPEWSQPSDSDDEEKPATSLHTKPISNLEWLEFQHR